jgi:hypothetical protein
MYFWQTWQYLRAWLRGRNCIENIINQPNLSVNQMHAGPGRMCSINSKLHVVFTVVRMWKILLLTIRFEKLIILSERRKRARLNPLSRSGARLLAAAAREGEALRSACSSCGPTPGIWQT